MENTVFKLKFLFEHLLNKIVLEFRIDKKRVDMQLTCVFDLLSKTRLVLDMSCLDLLQSYGPYQNDSN